MKFGYCTGFSTSPRFKRGEELFPLIVDSGFDYAEFPLQSMRELSDSDFDAFSRGVEGFGLKGPTSCNFFPPDVRLVGKDCKKETIECYLRLVLPRAKKLGINKIILGSGGARTYRDGETHDEAFDFFASTIKNIILPLTKEYEIMVLIEPFKRGESNLILSVKEGMELVSYISDPSFSLMIDIYHMAENNEDISYIKECFPTINHVHVAGNNRRLVNNEDRYVLDVLKLLSTLGYDDTLSFETVKPNTIEECQRSFKIVKDIFLKGRDER